MRGTLQFRVTGPEEASRIRQFLAGVFHMSVDAPPFEPQLIYWKYYEPHPEWTGSRSFVVERNGEIASHGCVWPMPFVTPSGKVPACQIIDWAASPAVPGAGMLLRREIEKMVAVSVAIGGSPDSRKVIPSSGYATIASFRKFVRVVRPLQQLRRRPHPNGRDVGKFGRNLLWSMTPVPRSPTPFTVEATETVDLPPADYLPTLRSRELYQYLLDCPACSVTTGSLKKLGSNAGSFLLSRVDGQARIADLQTAGTPEDWKAAVIAVTREASKFPDTCEILASTCLDRFADALVNAGYKLRSEQPVFLLDRSKALTAAEVHITSVDYDDFFARFPDAPVAS